jgi:hypothetical protein
MKGLKYAALNSIILILLGGCGGDSLRGTGLVAGPPDNQSGDGNQDTTKDDTNETCSVTKATQAGSYTDKLDVLFVVDGSGSMNAKLQVLGGQLAGLPAEWTSKGGAVDLRVASLVADVRAATSGKFISNAACANGASVLSGAISDIETGLKCLIDRFPRQHDESDEELENGLVATLSAVSSTQLTDNRAAGFFRQDAGLAVIYAADENDNCYIPAGQNDDFDGTITEAAFNAKYADRCQAAIPTATYAKLRELQGSRPLTVAGILDPSSRGGYYNVAADNIQLKVGGMAIPQGIVNLNGLTGGPVADISTDPNKAYDALYQIGAAALRNAQLQTVFPIPSGATRVDSVVITDTGNGRRKVDFQTSGADIYLTGGDRGSPGAAVEITSCVATAP